MAKIKSTDTLALDPTKQKKVSRETKNVQKKLEKGEITIKEERKAQKMTAEQKRGLIFISHLPHGFYENELKSYFKQFGKVTNVKVCRSSRTGRSKGYGYVEFAHPEVAKIAGETMNNYLMFKKRLIVDYIPYEKRPKKLFHGKSSTESKYSSKTRRLKQFQADAVADEDKHSARTKKRLSRLNKKIKRLCDLGIDTAGTTGQAANSEESSDPELEIKRVQPKRVRQRTVESISRKRVKKTEEVLEDPNLDVSVNIVDPSVKKDKKAKNTGILKNKKKLSKIGTKQNTKMASLNPNTVRKIARELIRKKGSSLLTFPSTKTNKNKKK